MIELIEVKFTLDDEMYIKVYSLFLVPSIHSHNYHEMLIQYAIYRILHWLLLNDV